MRTSLYVHVPFCINKCDYCAFFSVPLNKMELQGANSGSGIISSYLDGLEREIALCENEAPAQGVSSLFIGGGTPTALAIHDLERLLNLLHTGYRFSSSCSQENGYAPDKDTEKTIESNPGTIDPEKLSVLRGYDINRISVGVQSFDDHILKTIGRIHSVKDIYNSVELIRKAGFDNLNMDLMFGLPGQRMRNWQDSLKQAVALNPEHLSLYALTVEEGTPLDHDYTSGKITIPDDDSDADMYQWAVGYLQSNGYIHYEVSNFAKPGFECRHNLTYWRSEDYTGLGPGAVSCVNDVRSKNMEDITDYRKHLSAGNRPWDDSATEILTKDQRISEYMMLGLRTTAGIDLRGFADKFGAEVNDVYGQKLQDYLNKKILLINDGRLMIDPAYFFVLNGILVDFIR
ncbi:radical SAM family heme chaperone HemW [Dehalobacter sp. DCM]|uniref:radical SAM family heme chaperone HemW n=1 Tax=Dehalobacter sp. DCM TaxID=2907827 RepID=UPI003081EB52|nr:radical SAM family heme chaperone HemW [Dehalobacter sp. DCM]